MEEGVVPQTAQARNDAGTGEGSTAERFADIGEKFMSLTGDSGSYSFSIKRGQGLDIFFGEGIHVELDLSEFIIKLLSGYKGVFLPLGSRPR